MSQLNWQKLDIFNPTPEHALLRKSVANFVEKEVDPGARARDKAELFDLKLFRKLGDLGLLGITVPAAFGGSEMDPMAAVIVHEELSYSDPGFCLAYLAHSILCLNNISVNASDDQKKDVLPRLCTGEWIGAMAMTEPDAGTDVLGMKTVAKKTADGYVLNGRKMWITNGAVDNDSTPADCAFVYAITKNNGSRPEISTFLIKKGTKGYSVGQTIKDKTGMRASTTAELIFDNCMVHFSALVGKEGDSLKHMMGNLEIERLALAAMSLGIGRRALDVMKTYACERKSFGKELWRFGQIQRYLASSYAELSACRAYVYNTARNMNSAGKGNRLDSDGVKLVCSKMGKDVADRAMQVLGGNGYMAEYVVERLWRDAKLLEIGGGTIEAHQKNIAADLVRNS